MTHTTRALQSHDLSGEGIKLGITYILFWPHKDMEGLPGWVVSPMPGSPPRQHKYERQYTPSTHSVIPTRRIWNDADDGQMIFGDLGGPKISWHLSYRWGKAPKKTHPGNLSRPGIEPGPAAWQDRVLTLAPQRWTPISVIVYYPLLWRPRWVAKPKPEKPENLLEGWLLRPNDIREACGPRASGYLSYR